MSKFKKRTSTLHTNSSYFYEKEQIEYEEGVGEVYLYSLADHYQEIRIFELGSYSAELKLKHYSKEIKVQVKISQQAIFLIGEILSEAKMVCQESDISFQNWIKENFDFSYETANNFMNVFRYCLAFRPLAFKIPISILYKVSSPGFPDELRNFLFTSKAIEKSTSNRLKNLAQLYKEGGIESVEEEVYELGRGWDIIRQTNYNFDLVEHGLRSLEELKNQFETRGGSRMYAIVEYEEQLKAQQPEAMSINERLHSSMIYAITVLEDAMMTSREELWEFNRVITE